MEELVGILYRDEQKAFSVKCDALIDFTKFGKKGWVKWAMKIVEAKDDDLFSAAIGYIDDRFGEMIPADYKPVARKIALAVIAGDIIAFKESAPVLTNMLIDIPKMAEETEGIIIAALLRGLIDSFEVKLTSITG